MIFIKVTLSMKRLKNAYNAFIPKVKGATNPNDFRIISIINSMIKPNSKCPIDSSIEEMIDQIQNNFMEGRPTIDYFMTASKFTHFCKSINQTK